MPIWIRGTIWMTTTVLFLLPAEVFCCCVAIMADCCTSLHGFLIPTLDRAHELLMNWTDDDRQDERH